MAVDRLRAAGGSVVAALMAAVTAALLLAACGAAGGARSAGATTAVGAGSTTNGGIPAALLREARPIGRGVAFHPAAAGPVLGGCRRSLGARFGVHLELFAANRVALVAPGIGTRPPRRRSAGRITSARCYGSLVTLDPTGVIHVRAGARLTVADLFRSWGQPLSDDRLLSFHGHVSAYVDGRRWRRTTPMAIPLARHAEIVLEVGPHVPPHRRYHFPPGT